MARRKKPVIIIKDRGGIIEYWKNGNLSCIETSSDFNLAQTEVK